MNPTFYSSTSWLPNRLRSRLTALAAALLLAPAAWAQLEVPVGNPASTGSLVARKPLATYYGYERSAMIYTAAEIGTSGNITNVGFYVNSVSTPGAAPTKIYLKTVANATFAAVTTVATEEIGSTLVYDSTIPAASFTANTWVSVPLTTPFAYNGTSNLEVIVETNATGAGNEGNTAKAFRYFATGVNRTQYWQADNVAPAGTGALSVYRPNIQLTGLSVPTCLPVTALTVGSITPTTAQLTFTGGTGNTGYTITYTSAAGAATTVTPAPTTSPVTLTGLTQGTTYSVSVAGNCSGTTTSQAVTTSFRSTVVGPANDDCAGAVPLTIGAACTNTVTTNVGASASSGPNPTCGSTAANDVWYSIVVPANGAVVVTTSEVAGSAFDDPVMQLYSGSCTALTSLGCNDDASASTLFPSLTATGLTPGSTIYARVFGFRTTPTGQFNICATTLPTNDVAVQTLYTVGKAPVSSSQVVQAVVRNIGASARPISVATLSITGATTFTDVKVIPALAPGASTTITFAAYTPAVVGTNSVSVSILADDLATNNTLTYTQAVTANSLSYIDSNQALNATGVGVDDATSNGILAAKYSIGSASTIGEVKITFPANPTTTSTYQVVVLGATAAGTPDAVLFTSPTLNRPTTAGVVTVPVTGNVAVNGTFFVGVKEISGLVGVGYQVESPLRPATFYFQEGGSTTWDDVNTTTLQTRLALEVGFNSRVLSARSAQLEQGISVFPNPASENFTLRLPALAGQRTAQLTLINTLGQQVQRRTIQLGATGTDTQMQVTGLAKGIYTLRVQTNTQVATKQISVE
jgi:hypothetical protein